MFFKGEIHFKIYSTSKRYYSRIERLSRDFSFARMNKFVKIMMVRFVRTNVCERLARKILCEIKIRVLLIPHFSCFFRYGNGLEKFFK